MEDSLVDDSTHLDVNIKLTALIENPGVPRPLRLRAINLAQHYGDPRTPRKIADWCGSLETRNSTFGQPNGYWCYVPGATYRIGGWENGKRAEDIPLGAFWIARFPITVAQFTDFLHIKHTDDELWVRIAKEWWYSYKGQTHIETKWKPLMAQPQPNGSMPLVDVTWYEAATFALWLNEHVADCIPDGYTLRLPTDAEWEAAAAYDIRLQRRPYPWGNNKDSIPDLAIYYDRPSSKDRALDPVGSFPLARAACGALDMVGNIDEWTASSYQMYPKFSSQPRETFTIDEVDISIRCSTFTYGVHHLQCWLRTNGRPNYPYNDVGFRLVLAPKH